MSSKIEKPMSETTIQEVAEKEKRHREDLSPEAEMRSETSKRRELDSQDSKRSKSEIVKEDAISKTGFATAQGFASLAGNVNALQQAQDAPVSKECPNIKTTDDEEPSPSATQSDKVDTQHKSSFPKSTFSSSSGFGSFGAHSAFAAPSKSGGFSSLFAKDGHSGSSFSSMLDTSSKSSIFGKSTTSETKGDGSDLRDRDDDASATESEKADEGQYVAIKGLEKTSVPTGEERETCSFSVKAKLYAIDPKNTDAGWKERGIGTLRILEDETKKTRIVMRADAVLRVILNMPLHPKYKIEDGGESLGEKTIRIFGVEDGKGIWLALRVGSPKSAQELKTVLLSAAAKFPLQTAETNDPGVVRDEVVQLREDNAEKTSKQSQKSVKTQAVDAVVPQDAVEAVELANKEEIEKEKAEFEETTPISDQHNAEG